MTTLPLVEWETRHDVTLRPATAALLRSTFRARVEPSRFQHDDTLRWDVTPSGIVGALECGPDRVIVRPKVGIENLLFLLSVGSGGDAWKEAEQVRLGHAEDITAAVAALFLRLANRALARGVLRGYRDESGDLTTVRGRIDLANQLRRRPGILMPLAMAYEEHDDDILENRLLFAAASALRPIVAGSPGISQGLHRLCSVLSNVSSLHVERSAVPEVRWTRLNGHYRPAVQMARTVLRGASIDISLGEGAALGIALDMAAVFQDFLEAALTRELERVGGRMSPQASCFLDAAGDVRMEPDLVWKSASGSPLAVIDAKYKREAATGAHDPDLYQLLAYCTALRLSEGHLVYAQGSHEARVVRVVHGGPAIHAHSLDLTREPRHLMQEVAALAARIAATRAASSAR